MLRKAALLALLSLLPMSAQAQEDPGVQAPVRADATSQDEADRDTTAVFTGRVLSRESLEPVEAARVELLGRDRTTLTDARGRFLFRHLRPGTLRVRVSHLAARPLEVEVTVEAGQVVTRDVHVERRVIGLEKLEVEAEREADTPLERLQRRLQRGIGQIITREELEDHHGDLPSAFIGLNGVTVLGPTRGSKILMRPITTLPHPTDPDLPSHCEPTYYLNGRRTPWANPRRFDTDEVAAVEVYLPEAVPPERGAGSNRCGVMVIWEKRYVQGG